MDFDCMMSTLYHIRSRDNKAWDLARQRFELRAHSQRMYATDPINPRMSKDDVLKWLKDEGHALLVALCTVEIASADSDLRDALHRKQVSHDDLKMLKRND